MKGELKILTGAGLFVFIPVLVKLSETSNVYVLLFGRLFFASLILLIFRKRGISKLKLKGKTIIHLFIWSCFMMGAMLSYFSAICISGIALPSSLLGTQPLILILLSLCFLKEKISSKIILAGALTVIGILLISYQNFNAKALVSGSMLSIFSALLLSLNFIYHKKYLNELKGTELVFFQSLFQLPMLIPFIHLNSLSITFNELISMFALGLICTVVAYSLIYSGASKVNTSKVGILQSIEYILPVFIGLLFFKEKLEISALIGIALILLSCILILFPGSLAHKIIKSPKKEN